MRAGTSRPVSNSSVSAMHSRRFVPLGRATLLAVALAGCRDATGPDADAPGGLWAGTVTVVASGASLSVRNDTPAPIAYTAIDATSLIDWGPCANVTPACVRLAPGGPHLVPTSEILGLTPGSRDVIFYWWHVVRAADGSLRPDSVHRVDVRMGA